jgi:hypothetical protein
VVEDLVQAVGSQEKELAEKNLLVADLQEQLARSGNFLLPLCRKYSTFLLFDCRGSYDMYAMRGTSRR